MREVPTLGKNTATSVPSTPENPCIAADPVSPLVAVKTSTRRPPAAYFMKTGSIESATSLNAPVLPWKSSRIRNPSAETSGIGSAAGKRESRRSTAAVRTSAGKSPNNFPNTYSSQARKSPSLEKSSSPFSSAQTGTYRPPSGASPRKIVSAHVASSPLRVDINLIFHLSRSHYIIPNPVVFRHPKNTPFVQRKSSDWTDPLHPLHGPKPPRHGPKTKTPRGRRQNPVVFPPNPHEVLALRPRSLVCVPVRRKKFYDSI